MELVLDWKESDLEPRYFEPQEGASLLGAVSFFSVFSKNERAQIYSLGEIRVFREGANVTIEGESSAGLFLVLEGVVTVHKEGANFHGASLAVLGVGKSFGELTLVDGMPRSATVATRSRAVLFFLPAVAWSRHLAADISVSERFHRAFSVLLAERLRVREEEFILSQKQLWSLTLRKNAS